MNFTQSLYTKILSGESICEAFEYAKHEVSKFKSDKKVAKFNLIQKENHEMQDCNTFWSGTDGKLLCKSDHIKFKN